MKRILGQKQISVGFIVLISISLIYAANSKNQAALIGSALVLAMYMLLNTICTIKDRQYKTIYWIALANLVNIFCIISLVVLYYQGKNIADIEQISKYILRRDALVLGFYVSLLAGSILTSNTFKIDKNLSGPESEDV